MKGGVVSVAFFFQGNIFLPNQITGSEVRVLGVSLSWTTRLYSERRGF